MRRWLLGLIAVFLCAPFAAAQFTSVTGVVKDPSGNVYVGCRANASFVPAPTALTQPLINGSVFPTSVVLAQCDSFGNVSWTLVDNNQVSDGHSGAASQWRFSITSQDGKIGFPCLITVTGAAQNISAALQVCAAPLPTVAGCVAGGSVNALQKNGGLGACSASAVSDDGINVTNVEPLLQNGNSRFKGPNPYVDATAFGVRALVVNAIPAISGITATTTGGLATVTVSTSSCPSQASSVCFVNSDGVVVFNAGSAQSMTTPGAPTVTPSNSRVMTGTGDGVAAPAGATTFNYLWFWCDVGGGCTAASPVGTTATGNALGAQSLAITSATRSNDTLTFNTASQPNMSVGTMVHTDGFSTTDNAAGFNGWWRAATVTAGGFTVVTTGLDTRNGASTASAGGGTANWWNYNKVTVASAPAAAYRGFACSDRASPGTYHVLGMALLPINPKNAGFTDGTLEFDDFGATMMAASSSSVPWYVSDANCTGAATNDNWVTTISSGAGTTNLTMSGNAPNSVTNGTIRFDNAPNITTVFASAVGPLSFPFSSSGLGYVTNSVLDLTSDNVPLMIPSGLTIYDTILEGSNMRWYGDRLPGYGSGTQFQILSAPTISAPSGQPGVFKTNGNSGEVRGLTFSSAANGISFMQDGGGGNLGPRYDRDNFVTSGSTDYMGRAFVCRGAIGNSCVAIVGSIFVTAGTQSMVDVSATPSMFCDDCGEFPISDLMGNARTVLFRADSGGGSLAIEHSHWQGGTAPLVTMTGQLGSAGLAGATVQLGTKGPILLDTMSNAGIAYLQSTGALSLVINCGVGTCGAPSSSILALTGQRPFLTTGSLSGQNRDSSAANNGASLDGIFDIGNLGIAAHTNYTEQFANGAVVSATSYPIFVNGAVPAQPTATVAAGGAMTVGSYNFKIIPVWQNGAEGVPSPASPTCTTSPGNQTCNVNWTTVPGNPTGYNLSDGLYLSQFGCSSPQFGSNVTSAVVTSSVVCGNAAPSAIPSGGPTMLMPGAKGIATPALTLTGFPVAASSAGLAVGDIAPGSNGQCINTSGGLSVWGSCAGTAGVQVPSGGVNTTPVTVNAAVTTPQNLMSYSFSAGSLNTVSKTFRFRAGFSALSTVNNTETVQLQWIFSSGGGTTTQSAFTATGATVTPAMDGMCSVTTSGATGAMVCTGTAFYGGVAFPMFTTNTNMNLTATVTLQLQVSFTTASASNSTTQASLVVEQLN